VIKAVERAGERTRLSYRRICADMKVPRSTFSRWRGMGRLSICFGRAGPAKTEPFDVAVLQGHLRMLRHGPKRSGGVGGLQRLYACSISRRRLSVMVADTRREANAQRRRALRRIRWHYPGVCWAIDDTEYERRDSQGRKLFINQLRDLASGYRLPPIGGEFAVGEEVAGQLAAMFGRYGAPLLLKRDCGGNLNHDAVNEVLREYFVLPLNSPPNYPPYNGAIENGQGELKRVVAQRLISECPQQHFEPYVVAAAHDLNHKPRAALGGNCSCRAFFDGKVRYTKRERRDAYAWITDAATDILTETGLAGLRHEQAAWRIAAENWLEKNGLISVSKPREVSPYFTAKSSHE
jgi:hypothetical protein